MKTKKRNKQLESIKRKLSAATAMLLVASTMMVSSTYAWFTLSTAPEVTGISTTVGANGNLEIALANAGGDAAAVTSKAGDSMAVQGLTAANLTWGNLVDLADPSYGLDKVVLLPAALNVQSVSGIDTVSPGAPLKTPVYGADGRVSALDANTTTALYDGTDNKWITGSSFGVRAIGAMSGQSETTVAFREARAQLSQKAADAKNAATSALVANGDTLGNIIIKKALEAEPTFTAEEVTAMKNMIAGLETALGHVGEALKYAALGRAASDEFEDATLYTAVKKAIEDGKTMEEVLKVFYGTVEGGAVTPADAIPSADINGGALIAAYNKYVATAEAVGDAADVINPLSGTSFGWNDISSALTSLINYDKVTVNGEPVAKLKDNISDLVNNVLANGVKVTMPTGSGVIADIADLAGDYSAGIKLRNVSYGSITVAELPATMNTKSSVVPDHLSANSQYILNQGAMTEGDAAASGTQSFTDTYGYIIDLFFRTNVAGSNLLLQTEAVDRIYSDSTEGATMGHGSTMVFTSENTKVFSETQMRKLMECIRIVFMDKNGMVLANAKLEVSGQNETTEAGKAQLTGKVFLYNAAGAKLEGTSAVLSPLTQNEGKMISALVYLDGNKVDNTMVANAQTSMKGVLNLQFASSAELVPMENNQVRDLAVNGEVDNGEDEVTNGETGESGTESGEDQQG